MQLRLDYYTFFFNVQPFLLTHFLQLQHFKIKVQFVFGVNVQSLEWDDDQKNSIDLPIRNSTFPPLHHRCNLQESHLLRLQQPSFLDFINDLQKRHQNCYFCSTHPPFHFEFDPCLIHFHLPHLLSSHTLQIFLLFIPQHGSEQQFCGFFKYSDPDLFIVYSFTNYS